MLVPPWHPHPDVWLLIVALEGSYMLAIRLWGPQAVPSGEAPATQKQVTLFTLGVLTLWVAAEWPIHDIAENYLFSVHMVQHMLISLVAPPLLLMGMPDWLLRLLLRPRAVRAFVGTMTRPMVALIVFNGVIILTHWPAWVDLTLRDHWFHFVSHGILFTTAAAMWWPVVSPLPEMPTLSYPGRMLYLFLQSIVPTVPASFLTFGSTPLYHYYVTAPRLWGLSVITDQRIAGLTMKIIGGLILWAVIAVMFFRWYAEEQTEGWDSLRWGRVDREINARMSRHGVEAPR